MSSPAISFDAPLKQATTVPVPSGVTFDQPLQSATSVNVRPEEQSQPTQPSTTVAPQSPTSDEITISPSDSLLTKAGKIAGGTLEGIGEGVFGTIAGASDLADKMTGTMPGAANHYLHTLAGDNDATRGTAQTVGRMGETLAEFILGDEALKGLSVSDRLLKASKAARTIEESPALMRIFDAGVRAIRSTAVGATQGALKSGGDVNDSIGAGIAGGVGSAVIPEAFDAVKAIPHVAGVVSEAMRGAEKVVQPELQGALRQMLSDVAAENGISVPKDKAMRDVAEHVGEQLKAKGSSLYRDIDTALGGTRFQSFDEQISNVRKALRNDTGVDHDLTGRLIERLNDLEDAKANAMHTAIEKGMDPRDFQQANAYWRQGSAIQDLSAIIRRSTSGLPENLKDGSDAANASNGEVVSPNKLSPAIHRMRDSGRLSQAIGPSRADELLRQVESARARTTDIAANRKIIRKVVTGGAAAAGATGLGYGGYEIAQHTLQ